MKWYNHRAYKQHIEDIKHLDVEDWRKRLCLEFVNSVAATFDRTYPRIGVLDINDLIQEGYLAVLTSWENLNWEEIKKAPEDEWQPIIWAYVQTGIKRSIYRAIGQNRDTIRIPEHYYHKKFSYGAGDSMNSKSFNTDVFLTQTFASFFNEDFAASIEYQGESYGNERLNGFLHDVMNEYLDQLTKQIIMMFYGIDETNDVRKSIKDIAKWLNKSPHATNKKKQRGILKLKEEEPMEQIEKYLLNSVQY